VVSEIHHGTVVADLRTAGCVFAEEEAGLLMEAASTADELDALVARRVAGLPLEQVLGWAEFRGLRISVDPGVFVPRRGTELLVSLALERAPARAVVVDLCCGSGAIGTALAVELDGAEVYGVEVDPTAVPSARRNLEAVGGHVLEGDLYGPLPADLRGRVDLVVACAPYVPSDSVRLMPPEARLHEPRTALDGGTDGLEVVRRVVEGAPPWLASGGQVILETSRGQASLVVRSFDAVGMASEVATDPERGATAVIGMHLPVRIVGTGQDRLPARGSGRLRWPRRAGRRLEEPIL